MTTLSKAKAFTHGHGSGHMPQCPLVPVRIDLQTKPDAVALIVIHGFAFKVVVMSHAYSSAARAMAMSHGRDSTGFSALVAHPATLPTTRPRLCARRLLPKAAPAWQAVACTIHIDHKRLLWTGVWQPRLLHDENGTTILVAIEGLTRSTLRKSWKDVLTSSRGRHSGSGSIACSCGGSVSAAGAARFRLFVGVHEGCDSGFRKLSGSGCFLCSFRRSQISKDAARSGHSLRIKLDG